MPSRQDDTIASANTGKRNIRLPPFHLHSPPESSFNLGPHRTSFYTPRRRIADEPGLTTLVRSLAANFGELRHYEVHMAPSARSGEHATSCGCSRFLVYDSSRASLS